MSSKAEHVRLIAVDPESGVAGSQKSEAAWRVSSWSLWGKVAASAGVLAVIGLAATFGAAVGLGDGGVTASLGAGLELPAIPSAAETASLVAAGGGKFDGAVAGHHRDVASAPEHSVVQALLGRCRASTYRHGNGSEKDDGDRDKAYKIPPVVIDKLAARLGGKKS